VSGSYAVVDLSISGPGGSLSASTAARTASYSAAQFDGYQAAPDCDGDGTADLCEITSGGSRDCDTNGRPDECDIASGASDCNANGILDTCEPSGTYPPLSAGQDACQNAEFACPGALYLGTTIAATNDGSTSCAGGSQGRDLWYRYRPSEAGTLTVSLCESSFDTVVSVHTACPAGPATRWPATTMRAGFAQR
jgi:hypothetical protein